MTHTGAAVTALAFAMTSLAWADVSTTLSGSTLLITGDDSADGIRIESASDGVLVVGVDGTLVDGTTESVTIPGVQRLTVELGKGGDHLTIQELDLAKRLDVRTGSGRDRVVLDGVRAGWTRIVTDGGHDRVSVNGFSRFRHLTVESGGGNDVVLVDDVWVPKDLNVYSASGYDDVEIVDTDVGNDLDVHLGDDDDDVVLADVTIDDDTHLDGGDGDDVAFFYGHVWCGDSLDLDGFGDDGWWWFGW